MRRKQPELLDTVLAADQIGALALGVPGFVLDVVRVSPSGWDGDEVVLERAAAGNGWLVTEGDAALPGARLWELLLDPTTFGN
jgi:hypothetical protein